MTLSVPGASILQAILNLCSNCDKTKISETKVSEIFIFILL